MCYIFVTHLMIMCAVSQSCPMPSRLLCPWDSPGKNPGVGCYFLLQGIFQTQGWNLCLLHCQAGSLPLGLQSRRCRFDPWVWKMPWRRKWQPTPVFFPGKSHRQRSLEGYSLWGRKRVRHYLATNNSTRKAQTSHS